MKRALAACALALLSLTACQPASTDAGTIKIGFIGPLTGESASYGNDILHGTQMAIEEINAKGGINGKKLTLIAEDGRCNGADSASAAQKLVNVDRVIAIMGGQCSSETLAAAPIAEAGKVLLISAFSSNPTVAQAGEYVFRDYPNDALKTKAIAKYLQDKGYKKLALVSENTDFATGFRASLQKDLPRGMIVFDEQVDPGTKDFRSLFTRLKKVDFDIFFPNPQTDSSMAVMMQQLREQGMTQQAITHDVGDSLTLGELAPEAVEGMLVVNVPNFGEGQPFETNFTKAYGKPQATIALAAYGYDDLNLVAAALRAGATDGTGIRDYLNDMESYTGVIGTFHFDANGDVVGVPYVLKAFKDGKTVKVSDIAAE